MTDIEIAQAAELKPIAALARERLGIHDDALDLYGRYKAKISLDHLSDIEARPQGRLVLVTAISPTPAGEGKTTTVIGLGDALNRIGRSAVIALRHVTPVCLGDTLGLDDLDTRNQ